MTTLTTDKIGRALEYLGTVLGPAYRTVYRPDFGLYLHTPNGTAVTIRPDTDGRLSLAFFGTQDQLQAGVYPTLVMPLEPTLADEPQRIAQHIGVHVLANDALVLVVGEFEMPSVLRVFEILADESDDPTFCDALKAAPVLGRVHIGGGAEPETTVIKLGHASTLGR